MPTGPNLELLENFENKTIHFEQQKAINQVKQRVFQRASQGAQNRKTLEPFQSCPLNLNSKFD